MSIKIDELTLGQVKELKSLFPKCKTTKLREENDEGDIRIVVLQRGWIVVGNFFQQGSQCWLENAAVVRKWGTSKGLGEIAKNGPTENTVLDPSPPVRFHEMVVVAMIDCENSKWEKKLYQ